MLGGGVGWFKKRKNTLRAGLFQPGIKRMRLNAADSQRLVFGAQWIYEITKLGRYMNRRYAQQPEHAFPNPVCADVGQFLWGGRIAPVAGQLTDFYGFDTGHIWYCERDKAHIGGYF